MMIMVKEELLIEIIMMTDILELQQEEAYLTIQALQLKQQLSITIVLPPKEEHYSNLVQEAPQEKNPLSEDPLLEEDNINKLYFILYNIKFL